MFKNLILKHSLKISNFKFQIVFILLAICSLLLPTHVRAQAQGIEVNPSLIQLDFATDKPQTTLTYTNHTNQFATLTFSASDVTELEDSYKIAFLNPKDAQNFKYGLSSWIGFSNTTLILPPSGKGTITVFIDKDKLSPGGHYGSILAQIESNNQSGNVLIKSVLATLVFVRTHTGKEYEKASISTFAPEQNFFPPFIALATEGDFPQNFLLRFTNSGDTYLTPYGNITLYDMWGNFVGKGMVNSGSLLVLPESLRRYEIPTQLFGSIAWPGVYHATLFLHFGKTNQKLSSTTSFFSFGTLPIVQICIVFILVTGIFLFWKKRNHA